MASLVDLSIIIVNWNSAAFVQRCLRSIYANTSALAFEIIVVDNASYDDCGKMVSAQFPDVLFIQSSQNLGFARANNLAFEYAHGEYILFLNPDTEVVESALETLLTYLSSAEEAGAVGGRLLNSDLSLQTSCIQPFPSIANHLLDFEFLRNRFPRCRLWGMRPLFEPSLKPVAVDMISGACLMMKRATFRDVGGFSAAYFMYAEDLDLCYNVQRLGQKCYYIPSATVIHYGGKSSSLQPDPHFASVMLRESLYKFLLMSRGRTYAWGFQTGIGVMAFCRILGLATLLTCTAGRYRAASLHAARAKWIMIFRWSLGLRVSEVAGHTQASAESGA